MPKKPKRPKPKPKRTKKRRERFVPPIFEHQRARSKASKKAWEGRWERSEGPVGPKGLDYFRKRYGKDFKEYDGAVTDDEYEEPKSDKKKSPPKKRK